MLHTRHIRRATLCQLTACHVVVLLRCAGLALGFNSIKVDMHTWCMVNQSSAEARNSSKKRCALRVPLQRVNFSAVRVLPPAPMPAPNPLNSSVLCALCSVLGSLKTTYYKKPVRDMSTEWTPGKVLRVSGL